MPRSWAILESAAAFALCSLGIDLLVAERNSALYDAPCGFLQPFTGRARTETQPSKRRTGMKGDSAGWAVWKTITAQKLLWVVGPNRLQ